MVVERGCLYAINIMNKNIVQFNVMCNNTLVIAGTYFEVYKLCFLTARFNP